MEGDLRRARRQNRPQTFNALCDAEPGDVVTVDGTVYTVAQETATTSGGLVFEQAEDRFVYSAEGCAWEQDVPDRGAPDREDIIPFNAVAVEREQSESSAPESA